MMTVPLARNVCLAVLASVGFVSTPAFAGCYSTQCYTRVSTPPVYDTVSEQHLVRAPRTVYRTTPPVYDTVSERVLVSPGGRRWEQSYDAYGQMAGCWVSTPPRYAVQSRRALVRPAEVIPETLPPVYASYSHRVLVQPAGWQWVPAAYGQAGYGRRSIPDAFGITGASSADVGVGLGFSSGSVYDGY